MTSSPRLPSTTSAIDGALITCDPDFVLPDRSESKGLPVWVVVAVALTTAWAAAIASRHA